MSYIIPRRRQRCVCAFSLQSTDSRIDAYSPPTVLPLSEHRMRHRSVLIPPAKHNALLSFRDSGLFGGWWFDLKLREGFSSPDAHRVVLLSERIETKINLHPSCHLSGYNPLKSIIPVLQTLILHKENTGNVLCRGYTSCRLFLSILCIYI